MEPYAVHLTSHGYKGRVKCTDCNRSIKAAELRLTRRIQIDTNTYRDTWFDFDCFFSKHYVANTDEIRFFEYLSKTNQDRIKMHVGLIPPDIQPETSEDAAADNHKKLVLKEDAKSGSSTELPYRAEYSKSSRAKCKGCKKSIGSGVLRMATLTQSAFFDGKQANWFHFKCFFNKQRVKTTDDIEHFESLKIADQDRIKEHVGGGAVLPDPKGKKRTADAAVEDKNKKLALKEYAIEYAKSGRSTCKGCMQKIIKDEIRVSKKDYESDIGRQIGGSNKWHHLSCFAQLRSELGFFECGDKIPGFKSLKKPDQVQVKEVLEEMKQEEIPEVKKIKLEEDPNEEEYREQNKLIHDYRDKVKALPKHQLIKLFEHNGQAVPEGLEEMYDRLSDLITFGALKPCKDCKDGQLVFSKMGYVCKGHLSGWVKCSNTTKDPERTKFVVPKNLKDEHPFLEKYKYKPKKRVIKDVNPTAAVEKKVENEVDEKPKVVRALPALYDMEFVILGQPARGKDVLKKQIQEMGGKVVTTIKSTVMAVIADREMVEKNGSRIQEATTHSIHVVPEDFVDDAKDNPGKIPDLIVKKSICNWGDIPLLPPEPSASNKSRSRFTSKVPSKVKLTIKGGSAVDPDSGIADISHVYEDGDNVKYTAVLGMTDVQSNKNSFYKLQLLESLTGGRYWVFKAWGRIGTTIGGHKTEDMFDCLWGAKQSFANIYAEQSGNRWEDRHNFIKVPGKMYPIDIEYDTDNSDDLAIVQSESKLPEPVQDLMSLIFDVKQMKKLMLEFELDTEKMPLGKLSKRQIQEAYKVLAELQTLVEEGTTETKLVEATNRFYTLIPHNFGVDKVTILREKENIKQKLDMLNSLLEIEIAYNLMLSAGSEHTADSYYKKLNTDITVLEKNSEEFTIIEEYLKNTHGSTHAGFGLNIEDIFVVQREGEDERFKPFKKLHNRKLLWHGSRTPNFAGILSQGLRIAPPEAPVTGYMFGKGIYFADMVSKSANYCCTSPTNSTGILLLCEVALGNTYDRPHSDYITKLPKGKHSCKGVGRTHPDPSIVMKIDGVEVPVGEGVPATGTKNNSLLYNEYIVYDVAQVRIKYLLKTSFNYGSY